MKTIGSKMFRLMMMCLLMVAGGVVLAKSPLLLAEAESLDSDKAASRALEQVKGGKVLGTKRIDKSGRPAYRVKMLTPDGRIKGVVIDSDDSNQ